MRLLMMALFLVPTFVLAHGGRLDSNGGHNQRSTGEYHCHREPCLSQHRQVENATTDALLGGFEFTNVYNRNDWPHWSDFDRDCQNTRAEFLIQASLSPVQYRKEISCVVHAGVWIDPFTGNQWVLASDLDIDHVVPLKWAHQHGASSWSTEKKEQFANDFDNLLAVEDNLNQSKGARSPSEWMPPFSDFHCDYLTRWKSIVHKYDLTWQPGELNFVESKLLLCDV